MKKLMVWVTLLSFTLVLSACTEASSVNQKSATVKDNASAQASNRDYSENYTVTSEYLLHPERVISLADQTADFWLKALDKDFGGFYTYVLEDGSIDKTRLNKIAFNQSQNAYAMVKAYQLTGNRAYLQAARNALDFLYENAWDSNYGGWFQEMNRQGEVTAKALEKMDWNSVKWTYNQLNILDGIASMVEVTQNPKDQEWLKSTYELLTEKLWDPRPGLEGYYDMTGSNWFNPQRKDANTLSDAIPAHQIILALSNSDPEYKERLLIMADRLVKVTGTKATRGFGVDEHYDLDWKALKGPETTYSGNLVQMAWSLAIAYTLDPKAEYEKAARTLMDEILNSSAYDYRFGGSYAVLDAGNGNPTDWQKAWWVLGKSVSAGLLLYDIDAEDRYLKMADDSMNFLMQHLYDFKYGDVYAGSNGNGNLILSRDKAGYWKNASDTLQLFYTAYLYGTLILNNEPVSLYYFFEPQISERSLVLKPSTLGSKTLCIKSVTLDGKPYEAFNSASCTLKLPASIGGEFKVTFEPQ